MVFDVLVAITVSLLGAWFGGSALREARLVRREQTAATSPPAGRRWGAIAGLAMVAILLFALAAAAIAVPRWIDTRAGLRGMMTVR